MKAKPADPDILIIREQRVVLDSDLARIYGVPTFRFNEAVKRNRRRFPPDFAFQVSAEEFDSLTSQIAMLKLGPAADGTAPIVKKGRGQHRKTRPWVFTEHGALMAANVLRSERATDMSIYVVRAFIEQREQLATSAELLKKIETMDRHLLEHDEALVIIWEKVKGLMRAPLGPPPKPKPRIGFTR